jgi:methylenetetrahydrofolate reductase (NADPH)
MAGGHFETGSSAGSSVSFRTHRVGTRTAFLKIKDILSEKRTISYEFFPPKTTEGIPGVFRAIDELKVYRPDFISVTYGAGGSTRAFTEEITCQIKRQGELEVMAHLTCVGQPKAEVHGVLERLEKAGVENVIALRGDAPRGQTSFVPVKGGFRHSTELIQHIRQHFPFGLAAACYPEGHTESPDLATDIKYTKLKVEKGADFLITQLFYDNNHFFSLLERAERAGIRVPIIPGVLPILSTSQIRRFATLCGATIPTVLDKQLERFADDDAAARELGVEYASQQVRELWDSGMPGVHFYVLNRSYSVSRILTNLGLRGHTGHPTKEPN